MRTKAKEKAREKTKAKGREKVKTKAKTMRETKSNANAKIKTSLKIIKKHALVWKKKSIFFDLEYWKTLLVRHNLDVMHIEKNEHDSIIGTLLNILGKMKDTLAGSIDL